MTIAKMIDPNDFVITRKRKKYKFAKFANANNCYELEEWIARSPIKDGMKPVVAEIGAGTGLFSVELAARYPDHIFVAIDVKADRLQKGAYAALERGIDNVRFLRARADQVDELFAPHSVTAIWLTFPDPFPRQRSAGRRLTHPSFLRKYQTCLKKGLSLNGGDKSELCGLYLKHDNPEFFAWSLEQLVADGWHIAELSFDLHESELSNDYKIMTTYEQRWIGEGRVTQCVRAMNSIDL